MALPLPSAWAEGSRSLHPAGASDATTARGMMNLDAGATYFPGATVNGRQFLYVYAQAGEYILLGSRNRTAAGTGVIRLFASPGGSGNFGNKGNETVPADGTAVFTCTSGTTGLIANRNAELAGPNSVDGTSTVTNGWTPCAYLVPPGGTGIYGVMFTGSSGTGGGSSIDTPITHGSKVSAWDITVRASASTLADLNGRVFTYAWGIYTGGNNTSTNLSSRDRRIATQLYYVSSDGYRYKQEFRGTDPNQAAFYANSRGFLDTDGNPLYRDFRGASHTVTGGRSTTVGITAQRPEYPVFFSDVAPGGPNSTEVNRVLTALAIPHAPLQPVLTNPAFIGNIGGNTSTVSAGGMFTFDTVNTLTYEIVIKRGAVPAVPNPGSDPNHPTGCVDDFDPANVCNRVLTGTALTGSHSVLWNGRDNNGHAFPAGNYPYKIVGRNGEIHFPIADIEGNVNGGPTLTKLNGNFLGDNPHLVYFDDRGYRAANGMLVGEENARLCGNTQPTPVPTYNLVGIDSNAIISGSGNTALYYRHWGATGVTGNTGADCVAGNFFGDAKGLDLWALEKSEEYELPIVVVAPTSNVDVGTMVTVTPAVLPGNSAFGTFVFTNAGSTTANGVTYAVTLGNPAVPATCPAAVNFTMVPMGVTATYNPAPACTITFSGMPTTLTSGQTLTFNFNYVVAPTNPGPIPITTQIAATNETPGAPAPNTASAQTVVARPVISVAKNSTPAPGSQVAVNDLITYSLSVTIANAPLTAVLTLDDLLGTGLTFGSVIGSHPSFSCSGSLTCTLPIGTAIGTYTVTYTATVNSSAVGVVANNVSPSGGGGDNPPSCAPCQVEHPLPPSVVTVSKSSSPASGTEVIVGQVITYTVTAVVSEAPLTAPLVLTDVLGPGLTFGSVTVPGAYTPDVSGAPTLTFTLPTGTAPGSYPVTYTATVANTAIGSVGNNVTGSGGGGDPPSCTSCTTTHPLGDPVIVVSKSSSPASGTEVIVGQVITYTVTAVVSEAPLTAPLVLTDVLGPGLTFGSVTVPGAYTPDVSGAPTLTFTLPTGTAPGSYPVTYTATVANTAIGSVGNNVTGSGGGGDPPSCTSCTTTHPLGDPVIVVSKSSSPASGTEVIVGQVITYTVTAVVSEAPLTAPLVLTDVLGPGLTFGSVTVPGAYTPDVSGAPTLTFTLPTGTAPGSYPVTYTATVANTAIGSVGNNVTGSGGGGDPPSCTSCTTTHPLGDPNVEVSKAANPVTGSVVSAGDTIVYTVTVEVSDAPLTAPFELTDTLSAGLTLGTVTAGPFSCNAGNPLVCSLPTGTAPGTYALVYEADVDADASGTLNNVVVITGNGGDPDPVCTSCGTSHPVAADVTMVKALVGESGSLGGIAEPGETLTYTITLTNTGGVASTGYGVTDPLDANVTFVSADNGGTYAAGIVTWSGLTVPAHDGVNPGTLVLTVSVQVASPLPAGVTQVANLAYQTGTTPPSCPPTGPQCVVTPTEGRVAIVKTLTGEDGSTPGIAEPGEQLTYTITLSNDGGTNVTGYGVTDQLDANVTFVSADNGGTHGGGLVTWAGLTVPASGSLVLTVVTEVADPLPAGVTQVANLAYQTGTTPPSCPPSGPQCVVTPTPGSISVTKALSGESIAPDGIAEPGEELTYTITVLNHGGTAELDVIVNEWVPDHTVFVGGAPTWTCAPNDPPGTHCETLVDVPAHDGSNPGVTTLTFTVRVDDPLATGVTSILNAVATGTNTPPNCVAQPTHPQCVSTPTVNVSLAKNVVSVSPTGPNTWRVIYSLVVTNTGGSPSLYTLTDTLGFTPDGVVFNGVASVTSANGVVNPALLGGTFLPANGMTVQLSDALITLPAGVSHTYQLTVPFAVVGALQNPLCNGTPGNGLYNAAAITGSVNVDTSACAPVNGDTVRINLVKTVDLEIDQNGNNIAEVGDVLRYDFVITNTGSVDLSPIQLLDPRVTNMQCQLLTAFGHPLRVLRGDELFGSSFEPRNLGALVPGDSMSCWATYTITQADVDSRRVSNTATTAGSGPGGQIATATATAIFTQFP